MSTAKVAVTLEQDTLEEIDRWVKQGQFPSDPDGAGGDEGPP